MSGGVHLPHAHGIVGYADLRGDAGRVELTVSRHVLREGEKGLLQHGEGCGRCALRSCDDACANEVRAERGMRAGAWAGAAV